MRPESPQRAPQDQGPELRTAARGGAATLLGSTFSAAMGFVLSLVLARALGAGGSGVALQSIAVFTIVLAIARFGMDTAAVWILPRVRGEMPAATRAALVTLLGWTVLGAVVAAGLLWTGVTLVQPFGSGGATGRAVQAVAPFLPFGAVMMVSLAATRGFGGVLPFNLVGNLAVPLSRPLAVLLVAVAGGSAVAASLAWAMPLVPAAAVSVWLVFRQLSAFEQRRGVRGPWLPDREINRRVLGFALPRTLASGLEQSVVWLDVILVGVVAGPAAAGIYGAVSRFVSAGVIVSTALRVVVAPRFSAGLAKDQVLEIQGLYTATSRWILLFGTPIYVVLAWFAPTVLGWLGPEFGSGVNSMVVLCIGSSVVLAAGNIQSLLLMSGRTGWGATNKLVVVLFNVVGNLALIPVLGILGAALTWAASMALDTGLAVFQVRRFTGVRPRIGVVLATLIVATVCASVPSAGLILLRGNDSVSLVAAAALSVVLVVGYGFLDRRRLQLDVLRTSRGN